MEKLKVPKANDASAINPNWEIYRKQLAVSIRDEPECLTSNWLRITEWPDSIRFYEATGALNHRALGLAVRAAAYPMKHHRRGVLTFLDVEEVNQQLSGVARFEVKAECGTLDFIRWGMPEIGIAPREASNHLTSMLSQAWENHARSLGLIQYAFSGSPGFHAGEQQAKIGRKIPWGKQADRRSAMLRNIARGKVWSFGVSALPSLWPFPHLKLKARVLFSDLQDGAPGSVIQSVEQQFRLRRTVCKGWRNKQWHGRLMAYLEILSSDSAWVSVPLGAAAMLRCDAHPLLFTSPVTTQLADELSDEDEETDPAILGGYAGSEEEED